MSPAGWAPAGVGFRAGSVGSVLWMDVTRALAQSRDRIPEDVRLATSALSGAEMMTEPGSDDRAWLSYLNATAHGLLYQQMGWDQEIPL